MNLYVVILAGGIGTRLWPRSRQSHPKQFSDISGTGRTMIQSTADRLGDLVDDDKLYVVTGERYAALTAEQLPQIPAQNIIVEPSGRNTGPAIGLACIHLHQRDPEAVFAVLPADHIIPDEASFQASLRRAAETAQEGHLVTLGVTPTFAHTGYGYIQRSSVIANGATGDIPVFAVERFLEKPDLSTAEAFLNEGGYYWNGGIFVSRVDNMMTEIERQIPDVHACLQEISTGLSSSNGTQAMSSAWEKMPSISIDYGVAEGAKKVAVVPLDAGWNDVGSWDALESVLSPDTDNNFVAQGDLLAVESRGNIVYANKPVALIGVEGLVAVDTGDALLIGHKSQMQKVKTVVEQLQGQGRTELL